MIIHFCITIISVELGIYRDKLNTLYLAYIGECISISSVFSAHLAYRSVTKLTDELLLLVKSKHYLQSMMYISSYN